MELKSRAIDIEYIYSKDSLIINYPPRIYFNQAKALPGMELELGAYQHYFCKFNKVMPKLCDIKHANLINLKSYHMKPDNSVSLEYEKVVGYIPMMMFMDSYAKSHKLDNEAKNEIINKIMVSFKDWKNNIDLICSQIQGAVNCLDKQGLVHPDLALNNILWSTKEKKCKIIDYKTVKPILEHCKHKWYNSPSYAQTVIDNKLKVIKSKLAGVPSPWR